MATGAGGPSSRRPKSQQQVPQSPTAAGTMSWGKAGTWERQPQWWWNDWAPTSEWVYRGWGNPGYPGKAHGMAQKMADQTREATAEMWNKATTLGGPQRGGHGLPMELRHNLIREIIQAWTSEKPKPDPDLKICPVAMLHWPAEVVDGVIYYLTRAQRTTNLKMLGGSEEEVTQNLIQSFLHTFNDDEKRETAVRWLAQEARFYSRIFDVCIKSGFVAGTRTGLGSASMPHPTTPPTPVTPSPHRLAAPTDTPVAPDHSSDDEDEALLQAAKRLKHAEAQTAIAKEEWAAAQAHGGEMPSLAQAQGASCATTAPPEPGPAAPVVAPTAAAAFPQSPATPVAQPCVRTPAVQVVQERMRQHRKFQRQWNLLQALKEEMAEWVRAAQEAQNAANTENYAQLCAARAKVDMAVEMAPRPVNTDMAKPEVQEACPEGIEATGDLPKQGTSPSADATVTDVPMPPASSLAAPSPHTGATPEAEGRAEPVSEATEEGQHVEVCIDSTWVPAQFMQMLDPDNCSVRRLEGNVVSVPATLVRHMQEAD